MRIGKRNSHFAGGHRIWYSRYAKIETERLQYLRREQSALRADNYKELHDAIIAEDGDLRNVGQKVVLPPTFTSGP